MTATALSDAHTLSILLVEDNPADALFVSKGLARLRTPTRLRVAPDAEKALDFLSHDESAQALVMGDKPDLILLDLNLPGIKGLELLETIRHDPHLAGLPVLILTSSSAEQDVRRARELKADEYLLKPPTLIELFDLLARIEERWLKALSRGEAANG